MYVDMYKRIREHDTVYLLFVARARISDVSVQVRFYL